MAADTEPSGFLTKGLGLGDMPEVELGEGEADTDDMGLEMMADDVAAAIESGDGTALRSALKGAFRTLRDSLRE